MMADQLFQEALGGFSQLLGLNTMLLEKGLRGGELQGTLQISMKAGRNNNPGCLI